MAPRRGFEPRTFRLTAERSTVELPGKATQVSGSGPEDARLSRHGDRPILRLTPIKNGKTVDSELVPPVQTESCLAAAEQSYVKRGSYYLQSRSPRVGGGQILGENFIGGIEPTAQLTGG